MPAIQKRLEYDDTKAKNNVNTAQDYLQCLPFHRMTSFFLLVETSIMKTVLTRFAPASSMPEQEQALSAP